MKLTTKLWLGIGILVMLTPLGLMLPEYFKAGTAWGEWGTKELSKLLGYIPRGLEKLSGLWNAPIPDYAFQGWEEKGFLHLSFSYIISAIVGIAITVVLIFLIGKILTKKSS